MINRVERDLHRYLHEILLELQENSKEVASAILDVIRHDDIDHDDLREFLERQTAQLPSLEDVPERLQAMLFDQSVIQPTWENCLAFMESEGFEANSLIGYLDQEMVRAAILEHPIPSDTDSRQLRLFIFNAGSLSDAAYQEYARALPRPIQTLPEALEPEKIRILIDERKVSFTQENLDWLADTRPLQVRFVAINMDDYLADPENLVIDDDLREELLQSEIDNAAKLQIIEMMDLEALVDLPERSALIGSILGKTDANIANLNGSVAQSLITHSTSIAMQISLFNKFQFLMTDDEVRHVLTNLPKPFSEIRTGRNTPKLKNTRENQDLVRWLDSRHIISSWSERSVFNDDIRVNLYRS